MKNMPANLMLLVIISFLAGTLMLVGSLIRIFLLPHEVTNQAWSHSSLEGIALGVTVLLSAYLICSKNRLSRYITPLIILYFSISSYLSHGDEGVIFTVILAILSWFSWRFLNHSKRIQKYYAGNSVS
jgi:hypothetical protein